MPGMKKKPGEYKEIWRPKSKASEGPKKSTKVNPYKDTWRPKSKASEGPKKSMPRKSATKKAAPNMPPAQKRVGSRPTPSRRPMPGKPGAGMARRPMPGRRPATGRKPGMR